MEKLFCKKNDFNKLVLKKWEVSSYKIFLDRRLWAAAFSQGLFLDVADGRILRLVRVVRAIRPLYMLAVGEGIGGLSRDFPTAAKNEVALGSSAVVLNMGFIS